jgi:anti-sigma regulatory factor (Ser/Thr protein kinase)
MENEIRQLVLKLVASQDRVRTRDILNSFSSGAVPSRQYLNIVMQSMAREGLIVKGGSTRGAFYVNPKNKDLATGMSRVRVRVVNEDLKEHEIMDTIKSRAPFYPTLKQNVQDILNFGFSEMLNNAIEHSESKNIEAIIYKTKEYVCFEVNDVGIGVFKSILTKKHLKSELEAIQDLLKGKTTTMPQAHSGEGIFFTSKMADLFVLESFDYALRIDNELQDLFVEPLKPSKRGTKVLFKLKLNSKRHTTEVFRKYVSNPDTLAFDKTNVNIKLYTMGTIHVSRSQARRVLNGLDKFKNIVLDFDKVPTAGQGFADEIFRVFQSKHPDIVISSINTNEAVQFMIDRVRNTGQTG